MVTALLGTAAGLFSAVFFVGIYYMCIVLKNSYWYEDTYNDSVISYTLDLWGIMIVVLVLLWGFGALIYPSIYFNRTCSIEAGVLFTTVLLLFLGAALYLMAPILLL